SKNIIHALKAVSRYCELNITDEIVGSWHKEINRYLHNFATCKNQHQEQLRSANAEKYLRKLVNGDEFLQYYSQHIPKNLKVLLEAVVREYSSSSVSNRESGELTEASFKSALVKGYN